MKGNRVKRLMLSLIAVGLWTNADARTWYVATTGSDTNAGTFESPFATIARGVAAATTAGDTIYVRGGNYPITATITLSRSGTSTNRYYLLAYPGERARVDCSAMPVGSSNRGIRVSGSYWYIKGFDVWKAGDNGMNISGSNNIVEFCTFSENADTGLQLGGGASNNQIINCDSYYNVDPSQGNADGFAPKLDVGTGNYFYGCRAWQNSDDGWDGYIRPRPLVTPTTTLENCWTFSNGYLKTGGASTGNGNGFKMGGSDTANLSHNMILKKCLAFRNRVKGFDQNNNRGSMTLYNCTAFSNGTNYGMNGPIDPGSTMTLKNCISAGSGAVNLLATAVQATNSWMSPFIVTNDDFVSVDTAGVRGPRNPDGSLPTITFMHLAQGSDLIDAGTYVGLPYLGNGPDLGCFEYDGPTGVGGEPSLAAAFRLEQNYPNPFNPTTTIAFHIPVGTGHAPFLLKVYDILGREVRTLVNDNLEPGNYEVTFSAEGGSASGGDGAGLPSGVYFYTLQGGGRRETKRMLLLK